MPHRDVLAGDHRQRIAGMLANYDFINEKVVAYFRRRLTRRRSDVDFALAYVKRKRAPSEQQQGVIAALASRCDVLWAQLDALHYAYVYARRRSRPARSGRG